MILSLFKYMLAAAYILFGACIQMSASMYVIQRDLIQIVCVKCIMLGDVVHGATVIPLLFWGGIEF